MAVDILAAAEQVAPQRPQAADRRPTSSAPRSRPASGRPGSPGISAGRGSRSSTRPSRSPSCSGGRTGSGAVKVFDKMRTDPQIQGLLWGLTLPIRRYGWHVDPNGADDAVVRDLAEDFNLGVRDVPRDTVGRTKGRFSHDEHLRHALLALPLGHMFFEQSGEIVVQNGGPAGGCASSGRGCRTRSSGWRSTRRAASSRSCSATAPTRRDRRRPPRRVRVGARGVQLGGPVDPARDVRAVADQAAARSASTRSSTSATGWGSRSAARRSPRPTRARSLRRRRSRRASAPARSPAPRCRTASTST
jgi:hypothetical protein